MNQWMFDSVWRVRVTKVAFHPTDPDYGTNAWEVTMPSNNGAKYEGITPNDTLKNNMQPALANGDTIAATETTHGNLNQQQLDFSFVSGLGSVHIHAKVLFKKHAGPEQSAGQTLDHVRCCEVPEFSPRRRRKVLEPAITRL